MTEELPDPGEVPVLDWLDWLDKSLITVDPLYQRPLDLARVATILKAFTWRSYGALVVVPAGAGWREYGAGSVTDHCMSAQWPAPAANGGGYRGKIRNKKGTPALRTYRPLYLDRFGCGPKQEARLMKYEGRFFPVFDQIPDDNFLSRWREYITSTGRPEDFDLVSTTKPTQFSNITLLSEEISVAISLRPGGDRVPCPFCAPGSPKFIRGRMAYFPDEKAIRFIGHRCAVSHFGDNYHHAEVAFRAQQNCRRYIELWSKIGPRYGDLLSFLDLMAKSAGDVQFVRNGLDEWAPGFAHFLHRELAQTKGELFVNVDLGEKDRHGGEVIQRKLIGTAAGLSFLADGYDVARDVRMSKSALATVEEQLPEWAAASPEHPSTNEILRRGRLAERALQRIPDVLAAINDGLLFLGKRNLGLIHQWGNRMDTPYARFEIKNDDRQLLIRSKSFGGEFYANVVIPDGVKLAPFAAVDPQIESLTRKAA